MNSQEDALSLDSTEQLDGSAIIAKTGVNENSGYERDQVTTSSFVEDKIVEEHSDLDKMEIEVFDPYGNVFRFGHAYYPRRTHISKCQQASTVGASSDQQLTAAPVVDSPGTGILTVEDAGADEMILTAHQNDHGNEEIDVPLDTGNGKVAGPVRSLVTRGW